MLFKQKKGNHYTVRQKKPIGAQKRAPAYSASYHVRPPRRIPKPILALFSVVAAAACYYYLRPSPQIQLAPKPSTAVHSAAGVPAPRSIVTAYIPRPQASQIDPIRAAYKAVKIASLEHVEIPKVPTTRDRLLAYQDANSAVAKLQKAGHLDPTLALIQEAAATSNQLPQALGGLVLSESMLGANDQQAYTSAVGLGQVTKRTWLDYVARYGKTCLSQLRKMSPDAADTLAVILPYVYLSDQDKGVVIVRAQDYEVWRNEGFEKELAAKFPVPDPPKSKNAANKVAYAKKYAAVMEKRQQARDAFQPYNMPLEDLLESVRYDDCAAMALAAHNNAVRTLQLKKLIQKGNTNEVSVKTLQAYGDAFLMFMCHKAGYGRTKQVLTSDENVPMLNVIANVSVKEGGDYSYEEMKALVDAAQTMSTNGLELGMKVADYVSFINNMALRYVEAFKVRTGNEPQTNESFREALLAWSDQRKHNPRALPKENLPLMNVSSECVQDPSLIACKTAAKATTKKGGVTKDASKENRTAKKEFAKKATPNTVKSTSSAPKQLAAAKGGAEKITAVKGKGRRSGATEIVNKKNQGVSELSRR